MGLWDTVSSVAGAVGDFLGSDVGSNLLDIGATVGGGILGYQANKKGAKEIEKYNERAIEDIRTGSDQALASLLGISEDAARQLRQAYAVAAGTIRPDAQQPGADSILLNAMTSDPSRLNPSQKIMLDDLIRKTKNSLAASSLRGAGRAGQAVLADATGRMLGGFYDTNQRRSDEIARMFSQRGAQTRNTLASQAISKGQGLAELLTRLGGQTADLQYGTGRDVAELTRDIGMGKAGAALATGNLLGNSLGALTSSINRDYDRYKDPSTLATVG